MTAFPRRASRFPTSFRPTPGRRTIWRVRPEDPHWPLVVMTVLTQLSVGAFATIWLLAVIREHRLRLGHRRSRLAHPGGLALALPPCTWAVRSMRIAR